MSGGSYNYLYSKTDELWESTDDLERMAERLELGNYQSAALATRAILNRITELKRQMDVLADDAHNLSNIWHAVEWADSGDGNEKSVQEEVDKFYVYPNSDTTSCREKNLSNMAHSSRRQIRKAIMS